MPYAIHKDVTFAAAHHIPGHAGKCRHLHGHNYRVRVHVEADTLDALGMVIDFADLKKAIHEVTDRYDHRLLNDVEPFDRESPTAEKLSEVVFRSVTERLSSERVRVRRVEVWENDTSCALYEP